MPRHGLGLRSSSTPSDRRTRRRFGAMGASGHTEASATVPSAWRPVWWRLGLSRGRQAPDLRPQQRGDLRGLARLPRLGVTACFASRKATARELAHAIERVSPEGDRRGAHAAGRRARGVAVSRSCPTRTSAAVPPRGRAFSRSRTLLEIPVDDESDDPQPDDAAEILFTSGTTSAPKAVVASSGRLARPLARGFAAL